MIERAAVTRWLRENVSSPRDVDRDALEELIDREIAAIGCIGYGEGENSVKRMADILAVEERSRIKRAPGQRLTCLELREYTTRSALCKPCAAYARIMVRA